MKDINLCIKFTIPEGCLHYLMITQRFFCVFFLFIYFFYLFLELTSVVNSAMGNHAATGSQTLLL